MTARDVRAIVFEPVTVLLDIRDGGVSAVLRDPDAGMDDVPPQVAGADPGPNWGTRVQAVALEPIPPTPTAGNALAMLATGIVLAVSVCGRRRRAFARHHRLLRVLAALHLPAADPDRIADAVHAVRRIGRRIPVRVACLEEATSAVVLLALTGRSAVWCHGIAPDPIRLHAWVADHAREPVAEPPETGAYTTVLQVPAR